MTVEEDRRYTLVEAEKALALRECALHGHSFDVIVSNNDPATIVCSRCDNSWEIKAKT